MTAPWTRFPDMPRLVAKVLEPLASPQRVGTRTPSSLTGLMPFIRVTRQGGPSDQVNDYARISVDVLGDNLAAAEQLAEKIRQKLAAGRLRSGAMLIDRVIVDSAPQEVAPWAPGINRYEARYTVISRRYLTSA